MINASRQRLFFQGVAVTMTMVGAWLVVPGCDSGQTPVAPATKEEVKVIGPKLNPKNLKVNVGSRREHQKEQAKSAN